MTDRRKNLLRLKLQASRFRLIRDTWEFALPLKDMLFVATKEVRRISTNGTCIYFSPDWLEKLKNRSLDFILAHQLMHIRLKHIDRPDCYRGDRYHLACDVVANSHLRQMGFDDETLPGIGTVYHETFFPTLPGYTLTPEEALECIPFDPANFKKGVRNRMNVDSEEWWDHPLHRGEGMEIVLSPKDKDPDEFPEEEEIEFSFTPSQKHFPYFPKTPATDEEKTDENREEDPEEPEIRSADRKGESREIRAQDSSQNPWESQVKNELNLLRDMKERSASRRDEGFAERVWRSSGAPTLNWKMLLNRFVQEEVCDYSFTPPDRRFSEEGFFLPDFNEEAQSVKNLLFLVDVSGSVDDGTLERVFSEICGAIDQFRGMLTGKIGFFDTRMRPPIPFRQVTDVKKMLPTGGGGTDFSCIFRYLRTNPAQRPDSLVIFTDGKGEFPTKKEAGNLPVLWIFTEKAEAPWGQAARIENGGR